MIKESVGGDVLTETLSNYLKMEGIMKHENISLSIVKNIKETHAEVLPSENSCIF
jgi:hypothetical protein